MVRKIRDFRQLLRTRLDVLLLSEIIVGLFLSIFSLLLFLKIGKDVAEMELLTFDSNLTNFIYSFRTDLVTKLMMFITFLGSPIFLVCISVVMTAYVFTKRKKDAVIYLAIIFTGVILNIVLKYLFQRPRPEYLSLIHENSYSFPSGHAMNSIVFYLVLAYFIFRETGNKKLTNLVLLVVMICVLLIGVSRVYLGVHYPTDVIAGYVAGFLWFVSAILFEKTIIYKRLRNKK